MGGGGACRGLVGGPLHMTEEGTLSHELIGGQAEGATFALSMTAGQGGK